MSRDATAQAPETYGRISTYWRLHVRLYMRAYGWCRSGAALVPSWCRAYARYIGANAAQMASKNCRMAACACLCLPIGNMELAIHAEHQLNAAIAR